MRPRPISDLTGKLTGQTIYIVAPGPSSEDFPIVKLKDLPVLAVNSAIEIVSPTWWLFYDLHFFSLYPEYFKRKGPKIILPRKKIKFWQHEKICGEFFFYHTRGVKYKSPDFLWGHGTIITRALCIARLLNAARIVCIGVDTEDSEKNGVRYRYNRGIKQKESLGGTDRKHTRALNAILRSIARVKWTDVELLTTSQSLAEKIPEFCLVSPSDSLRDSVKQ